MAGYMDQTFGNVTHVGSYTILVAPIVLAALCAGLVGRVAVPLYTLWLAIVASNAVVSGSRAAFAVGLAVGAFVIVSLKKGRTVILGAIVLLGTSMLFFSADAFDQTTLIERIAPTMGKQGKDVSLDERIDSIEIGWDTFANNAALGVGPGNSLAYNAHDVPHQSLVMVASETGVFGGLSFLLLNVVVLFRTCRHGWSARRSSLDRRRLVWIIGPASWLLGGLFAGLTFNMNLALLWVGIAYAMLGMYGFEDAPQGHTPFGVL